MRLTLTFVTPAFIGGANNSGQAEFRLPSLKGVLRYWWRQFQDQSDPQILFDKESRIFGSTKGQSRVWLRLLTPITELRAMEEDSPGNFERDGVRYLWYSCERRQGQRGRQKWIKENSAIKMEIRLAADPVENNEVLLALYFAQTFGGLGYRSRRGAGSFQLAIDPAPSPTDPLAPFAGLLSTTAQEFITAYSQHATTPYVWAPLIHLASPLATALTTANYFKAVNRPGATAWGDVLGDIGEKMRNYRSFWEYDSASTEPFHKEACALHTAGKAATTASSPTYTSPNPISKAAFGLPILYHFKERSGGKVVMGVSKKGNPAPKFEPWDNILLAPDAHKRRASPLFISVKKNSNGVPYANCLILWTDFLPAGEQVAITKLEEDSSGPPTTRLGTVVPPSDGVLTTFLSSL